MKRTGTVRYYRCHTCDWRGPRASLAGIARVLFLIALITLFVVTLFLARTRRDAPQSERLDPGPPSAGLGLGFRG